MTNSVTPAHTVLYELYCDGGYQVVEVTGYVIILSFLLLCTLSLYLAARHQKGNSSGTPAGAITYSPQWLCEQWEDWVCMLSQVTRQTHSCMHKASFFSHILFVSLFLCTSKLSYSFFSKAVWNTVVSKRLFSMIKQLEFNILTSRG